MVHVVLPLTKYNGKAAQLQVWDGEGLIPFHKRQWKALRRTLGKEKDNQYCEAFTRAVPALLGMLARRCVNCGFKS